MSVQINYVLTCINEHQLMPVQVFTEHEEAYKTMETAYEATILQMDNDELAYENNINHDYAQIDNLQGDLIEWIINKAFLQTPKIAAICRQYDEMIAKAERDIDYFILCKSSEFHAPGIEAKINACYVNNDKILYFAVNHLPFANNQEFIPFEAYKWCVDRGIKKISGIEEASQILACVDNNASFSK